MSDLDPLQAAALAVIYEACRTGAPAPTNPELGEIAAATRRFIQAPEKLGCNMVRVLKERGLIQAEYDNPRRRFRVGGAWSDWTGQANFRGRAMWEPEHDAELKRLYGEGKTDKEIGPLMNPPRSPGAIVSRRNVLGLVAYQGEHRVWDPLDSARRLASAVGADMPEDHPLELARAWLQSRAERVNGDWRLDGRPCGPRELVQAANRIGADIAYPGVNPHPKALAGGPGMGM